MPPATLGKSVIERQSRHIEAEIGRALHVVMAAEDVGAAAAVADIARGKQQNAARADVGRPGRVLGLPHRPDQSRRTLFREYLGDTLDLRFRQTGHALDLIGRPLLDLLADVVHPIDPLADELLVLPAVAENVPEHSVNGRNVHPRANADIFSGVRGRAREAGIDDDHVATVELLAFENVLQRHRMRLGRIAAHDHDGLGIADVVVAVGHRPVAPGIGDACDRGGVTNARLMIGIVGSPEGGELAVEIGGFIGELGGAEPVHRFGTRPRADLHQLVADLIDRLIPGDSVPPAVHQFHRIAQPTVAVHIVANGCTFAAVRATIDR